MIDSLILAPIIQDCKFKGNNAYFSGGGIFLENSDAIINNCTFQSN